jgi:hypothetical protein
MNEDLFLTVTIINLIVSMALFVFALFGTLYMRDRSVFSRSGKYAMYGLLALTAGGLLAAFANWVPGEQQELAYVALALRVAAFIFLATHVIFNVKHMRKDKDRG